MAQATTPHRNGNFLPMTANCREAIHMVINLHAGGEKFRTDFLASLIDASSTRTEVKRECPLPREFRNSSRTDT